MNIDDKIARMPSFGWGIIATGTIADKFARDLDHVPGARKVAVCSRDAAKAKAFAKSHGFAGSHGSVADFLTSPGLDIVYVASPHTAHHEHAIAAIEAGKAVLIEKPITADAAVARKIADAAKAHGVFAMEAMWSRFLPAVQRAKALIDNGSIGTPQRAHAELSFANSYKPGSRLFEPSLGGGVARDLGVYPVSVASYLLGAPRLESASWTAAPSGVDMDTRMELTCGTTPVSVHTSFTHEGENSLVVHGDKGVLRLDRHFLRCESVTLWDEPRDRVPASGGGFMQRLINKARTTGGRTEHFALAGEGLHHEAAAVQAALGQGWTEHPVMPLADSIGVTEIIDQVLRQPPTA